MTINDTYDYRSMLSSSSTSGCTRLCVSLISSSTPSSVVVYIPPDTVCCHRHNTTARNRSHETILLRDFHRQLFSQNFKPGCTVIPCHGWNNQSAELLLIVPKWWRLLKIETVRLDTARMWNNKILADFGGYSDNSLPLCFNTHYLLCSG